MRISELSRVSGVPIPTIKFYLREGLLPQGTPTARTQAEYSDAHLRRIRLIRTLTDIGGLRLRDVRAVLEAIDNDALGLHALLGTAHHALGPHYDEVASPEDLDALSAVDGFLRGLGWHVTSKAPARRALAQALVVLRRMGWDGDANAFTPYAEVADQLATWEVATVTGASSRSEAVEGAVLGTVVFEAALVALRRLALEHHSALRFDATQPAANASPGSEPGRAAAATS